MSEKIKVKNTELAEAIQALSSLAGTEIEGKFHAFQFDGKTRYTMARNLRRLKEAQEDFITAHDGLIKQFGGDAGKVTERDAQWPAYMRARGELLASSSEIEVWRFPLEALNLDKNAIPPHIITAMDFLLQETTTPA